MKILISEKEIANKVEEIAKILNTEYQNKEVLLISILKGVICFVSDLIRQLEFPFRLEFVSASSYGMAGTKAGKIHLKGFESIDVKNQDVLLIDDIYDTGKTLSRAYHAIASLGPKSLKTLVLLEKKVAHIGDIQPTYVCFDIEDHFVVGYGLDYKEKYRGLKAISIFEE